MRKRLLPLITSGLFRGFGAISQFLLAWWVSTMLAKDASGSFFLYLACYTVLSPVILLGTQYFGMRQISEFDEDDTDSISRHAYHAARLSLYAVSATFLVLLALALVCQQFCSEVEWVEAWSGMMVPLAFASAIGAVSHAVASHLHGLKRFGQSIFYSHICIPSVTIVTMAFLQPTQSQEVIYCHLFACIVSACIAIGTWIFYFPLPSKDSARLSYRAAWATSRDLWLIYCCSLSITWFPVIVGGAIVGTEDVAELNIGQRAANLINFVLIIITFAFAPRLRKAWAKSDLMGLRQDVSRCAAMLISVGSIVYLTIFIFAEQVLGFFGAEYVTGATILRIFATAQYFNVVTGSVNEILLMWGFEKTLRSIFFASAAACFLSATVLGMAFGAVGIACGAAIAISFHNIAAVWAVRRHLGFWAFDPRPPVAEGVSHPPRLTEQG